MFAFALLVALLRLLHWHLGLVMTSKTLVLSCAHARINEISLSVGVLVYKGVVHYLEFHLAAQQSSLQSAKQLRSSFSTAVFVFISKILRVRVNFSISNKCLQE
jgi:hypothetical protein